MTESARAVFLSYASQDAEAARRICEALRAAGIEVWFDQSELRGGEVWDQMIHHQIRDCSLFIPLISANTEGRTEGYFRREWRLAIERTHDMSDRAPFVVPVVIDDTKDKGADVPEPFLRVHWTRLPSGQTPTSFCDRLIALLTGTEKPSQRQPALRPALPVASPRTAVRWIVVAGATVLVAAGISRQAWRLMGPGSGPRSAKVPAAVASEKSIAVLPFVDMSEKHDQEYFSDGLSEELIDHLSHNADLKVIARTSSFAFKGKNDDIRTIARTLGVANLLEGSVRKAGRELRITAQLIRAADGMHLWSESYERQLTDVFKIQQEIATAVAKGLQAKLLPAPLGQHSAPHNIDAYSLYLRGQYFAQRASDADVGQGIAILKQAITLEPDFAPAHVELANAYVYVGTFGIGAAAILDRAREEIDKALRLDPTLRSARNTHANLELIKWDWAAAKQELDELLASGPRDSVALFRRGQLARALGHADEALVYYRQALQLNPLSVLNQVQLAMLLDALRRPEEARAAAEAAIAVNPTVTKAQLLIGLLELDAGRLDAAGAAFERESGDYYRLEGRAIVAFARKRRAESDAALGQLIATYRSTAAVQVA